MFDLKPHGNSQFHSKNWGLSVRTISQCCCIRTCCLALACCYNQSPFAMWHRQTRQTMTWYVANHTWKALITRTGDWVLERFRHVATFCLLGRVATGGCWSTDSSPFCDVTPPAWLASCRPDGRWPDMSRGAVANTLGFIWSAKIHEVDVRLYSKRDLKRLSQTLGFISETRHRQFKSLT